LGLETIFERHLFQDWQECACEEQCHLRFPEGKFSTLAIDFVHKIVGFR
jgi:hypothetical protein